MSTWNIVAGPRSSVIEPTELVEVISVGVVKIGSWREYDRGGGGSWEIGVEDGRWSGVGFNSSLPENFIKDVATLAVEEIGVHAQLVQSIPSTRVCAE